MVFAQVVTHLAVATPFLLLSSCRSLHVMEDGLGPKEMLIFGAHHKTGSSLTKEDSKCFDSSFRYRLDSHWKGGPIRPHEKAVHFTRNPTSLALSAYLYHKETGEPWTLEPGSAGEHFGKDSFLQKFLINRRESYTDFLRRVDAKVGIRAEIRRVLGSELRQMEAAEELCEASSRCMQICLEDFTVSSRSYDASWRKVMDFIGERMTSHIQKCLSRHDLNKNPKETSHVTSNSMSASKYTKLRNLAMEVDAKVFNSRLKKMGFGRLHCGASNFLEIPTGSNATDGGEYTGWLIEEEYS